MKKITKEELEGINGTISDIIDYVYTVNSENYELLKRPKKPTLKYGANSSEVLEYANLLATYENEQIEYEKQYNIYGETKIDNNSILEDKIKEYSGFYNYVPNEYRDKVWAKAWNDSHSGGYYEVYLKLIDLIEIFE